ncbi:MAG: HIT family protein [Ferruginibacter sp.]
MSVFEKIIVGEIPSYTIREDENFIAILDIAPLVKGHVLVIPKTSIDKIFDLPESYLAKMLVFAQPIARAMEATFDCNRVGLSVIGLEVPHAHMHLVPINSADDLNFTRKKLSLNDGELTEIKEQIISMLPPVF